MGNEIVYCSKCQSRLLSGDFENGKAVWSAEKPYCAACIMGIVSTLPPEEEQRILEQLAHKRAPSLSTDTPRRASRKTSTSRIPVVKTERRTVGESGPLPLVLLLGGLAIVVIIVLVALSGRSERPVEATRVRERTPEPPHHETATPKPPTETPRDLTAIRREESARKALDKAREYGKSNPADLPGRIALLEEAAWECRETSLAADARREHEQLQKQRGEWISSELASARDRAQAAAAQSRYGEALEILGKERGRHAGADWNSAVDQKILQIRQLADRSYAPLREKALSARRRAAEEEAQAILGGVAAWGLEDLAGDLRSALAAIPLPERPLSPEARAYLGAWENAFALARGRDFSGAIQGLEAAASAAPDPALKAEAAVDLELLRLCSSTISDVVQALVKWPKGQKISVEVDTGAGAPARIEGTALRTSPTWIEIKTQTESAIVEFDELTAACLRDLLAKLPGRKAEADARAGNFLLLLEGETSGAKGFPPRLIAYGTRLAQERARPEWAAREGEAHARFESAERDYQDAATRLEAFDKFRALMETHAESVFVRRKRAFIAQRLDLEKEAGKEYVFFADQMRAAGSFRLATAPKAATCWTSAADVPPDRENHVEFVFSARPSTEYRCWVFAGGCCAETFAFDVQGSEIERAPVKNSILFLKKTHALHGGRKEPARFEWIAVPLPKYSTGGPKTVRLMSGQQGFSIAVALVSSTRTAAPGDALVKEWERSRPPAPTAPPRDVGLVGWWTLDEGTGTTAGDSSPNRIIGTLRNEPVWTSGKRRGALSFDGTDDYVELPRDPRLYFAGPFSVAAWVNVNVLPKLQWGMYVVSDYTADGRRSSFAIRVLPSGAAQFFWQAQEAPGGHATSATRLTPGTWVHLAGVWDGTTRTIYVNGTADGSNNETIPRMDTGGSTSIGRPGAHNMLYFSGRIDDVRIYSRALSSAEIQSLATK